MQVLDWHQVDVDDGKYCVLIHVPRTERFVRARLNEEPIQAVLAENGHVLLADSREQIPVKLFDSIVDAMEAASEVCRDFPVSWKPAFYMRRDQTWELVGSM